jgi:D-glycero-alpha-D-manno-heptose 1-phosphate guanylyltransferase
MTTFTHATEAIILAGGLGTRLKDTVPDLPKCMAPVNDRPFLSYLFEFLDRQGIATWILSLGYRSEQIRDYVNTAFRGRDIRIHTELQPLGTGGAISASLALSRSRHVCVLNGDTYFNVNLQDMYAFHQSHQATCTLALKRMWNVSRYGLVETMPDGRISKFREKGVYEEGLINGGIYLIDRERFPYAAVPGVYSFEKTYLEKFLHTGEIYGYPSGGYFIDIGVPEDYKQANDDFKKFDAGNSR